MAYFIFIFYAGQWSFLPYFLRYILFFLLICATVKSLMQFKKAVLFGKIKIWNDQWKKTGHCLLRREGIDLQGYVNWRLWQYQEEICQRHHWEPLRCGIKQREGSYDHTTKTIAYKAEIEKMPGVKTKVRHLLKIVRNDHYHTWDVYS